MTRAQAATLLNPESHEHKVLKAWAAGERVEIENIYTGRWELIKDHIYAEEVIAAPNHFRIPPPPVAGWVTVYEAHRDPSSLALPTGGIYKTQAAADAHKLRPDVRLVYVRECEPPPGVEGGGK